MTGRGRGKPPKRKGDDRAKGKKTLNHSVSSISECSSSTGSDIETLIHNSNQYMKTQSQTKALLSNWIEAASNSKVTRPKDMMIPTQTKADKAGECVDHTKSGKDGGGRGCVTTISRSSLSNVMASGEPHLVQWVLTNAGKSSDDIDLFEFGVLLRWLVKLG
ncbi:unnamed protein product [Amaranthus hypochondriacus]